MTYHFAAQKYLGEWVMTDVPSLVLVLQPSSGPGGTGEQGPGHWAHLTHRGWPSGAFTREVGEVWRSGGVRVPEKMSTGHKCHKL